MKGVQKFTDRRFGNLAAKSMARGLCLRSMFKRSMEDESEGKIPPYTMYAVGRVGAPKANVEGNYSTASSVNVRTRGRE